MAHAHTVYLTCPLYCFHFISYKDNTLLFKYVTRKIEELTMSAIQIHEYVSMQRNVYTNAVMEYVRKQIVAKIWTSCQ